MSGAGVPALSNNLQGGGTMRRFMVHLVTEVEFEDGDEASAKTVQNYQKQLSETVRNAAQGLSLRMIQGALSRLGHRNQG